ncbi:hypothetical protein QCD79_31885, partial [Pseudomonas quasicaspiana]|nr:hypothetical protein [Pseudomonas quasicaspiana]
RAANFGEFSTGELSHARGLEKAVDDYSVTIFDRAYYLLCSIPARLGAQRYATALVDAGS